MGFSFNNHKRDVDKERHLRRLHKTTRWIESPLVGADANHLVFSQRHEANSVELFFDLFFVANLATFTAYHSITDVDYLLGYIGFFGILWATWFQITLHDVRFGRDTLYERVCKTIQFIVFVGLALVGSQFNPASKSSGGSNSNFRLMCYVLVLSRGLLAIQYMVVLFYTWKARYSKLFLPLGLMVGIYVLATAAFAGMTPSFKDDAPANHRRVYLVWYAVIVLEAVTVITISSVWRMLSFKKTHLMERMSLLTIIVIGEGAIGVTKTVSRIMGKHGPDVEGSFLVMCIIVILVFLWALYFDNFPHDHYGTIRQQVWSLLHFPLQLGIVGCVEGAQQLALARYVSKNVIKINAKLEYYCEQNLDGKKLQEKILALVGYYQLDKKLETWQFYQNALNHTYNIGNSTGICSPANMTKYADGDWPEDFVGAAADLSNGLYVSLGMKLPASKLAKYTPLDIAVKGWKIVYMYFWASFALVILSSIVFLFLIRRHKADLFDYTSVIIRTLVLGASGAMMALYVNDERLYTAVGSAYLLPIAVVLMFIMLVVDKATSVFCNWRLKKSGQPYALEFHEDEHHGEGHGHGHGHGEHGEVHETQHLASAISHDHLNKEPHYNERGVAEPYHATSAEYHSPSHGAYPMSPPLMSPNPTNPHTMQYTSGGYVSVTGGQNHAV